MPGFFLREIRAFFKREALFWDEEELRDAPF